MARERLPGKLLLQLLVKDGEGLGTDKELPVHEVAVGFADEEGGGAGDSLGFGTGGGVCNVGGVTVGLNTGLEALEIQLGQLLGVTEDGFRLQLCGVGDEEAAHLPELVLVSGAACGLRGFGGVAVKFEGQIPGDEAQFSGVDPVLLEFVEGVTVESAAEGALIIGKLDHRQGRVGTSEDDESCDVDACVLRRSGGGRRSGSGGGCLLLLHGLTEEAQFVGDGSALGLCFEQLADLAQLVEDGVGLLLGDSLGRFRGRGLGAGSGLRERGKR